MPDKSRLLAQIENAAEPITPFWPLKTFIATNPLAGFEDMPFDQAVEKGAALFGGNGLPSRAMGQKALADGKINKAILKEVLKKHGAENLYDEMISGTAPAQEKKSVTTSKLNALMIKYLAAFLDEGQSGWEMPGREKGFYAAWKDLAAYDDQITDKSLLDDLPVKSIDALFDLLDGTPDEAREELLSRHLAALPGWSGFIKWRRKQKTHAWTNAYPISLTGLLAVRFAMAKMVGDDGLSVISQSQNKEGLYWLEAWEETYRSALTETLETSWDNAPEAQRPEAQFVFCIDVRSEVFRRHLEHKGNYETYGFAGFFGVPIRHTDFAADFAADSCPVLLSPQFETTDMPCPGHEHIAEKHVHGKKTAKGFKATIQKLKNDIAAPFTTVEATGVLFGLGMTARTFIPSSVKRANGGVKNWLIPAVPLKPTTVKTVENHHGFSLSERIFHAEAALKVMGLTQNFAPYIFLTGHGSETTNNPYASGLDCGACGGNHGGPNARIMAEIFNDPQVREGLSDREINIPADTIFVGALHNTTTDDVDILCDKDIPDSITKALNSAKMTASAERSAQFSTKHKPATRAADWAEVRPEWGLARNAAFIVGPRCMTKPHNLQGRSFLHSYDWESDTTGKALEIILTAPMVVAEWINTQYYFSTVDNEVYGSGSKTTHNVAGKIGVMQGNASDLMTGLPQQSVMSAEGELYHEPLRLMTIVKAPLARVSNIIAENDILQTLFDNGWVALMVIDPNTNKFMRYESGKIWRTLGEETAKEAAVRTLKRTKEFETT